MAPCLVLLFYVRFLSFCWGYVSLNCRLSPMKRICELVAGGALYHAFGVIEVEMAVATCLELLTK